jgi:hypothetical protein
MREPSSHLPPFAPDWLERFRRDPDSVLRFWDNPEAISPFAPYFHHSALISPPPLEYTPFDQASDAEGMTPFGEGA